jgi:hypothetical protein
MAETSTGSLDGKVAIVTAVAWAGDHRALFSIARGATALEI